MPRFSLRTFLIACVVLGICLGLGWKWCWPPHAVVYNIRGKTNNAALYMVHATVEYRAFGNCRLVNSVVAPDGTSYSLNFKVKGIPKGLGLETTPSGVFWDGKRIGLVVIVLAEKDVRVIELSAADITSLEAVAGPEMIQSPVWKEKVEPEIERLVLARRNVHDRHALGLAP